LQRGLELRDVLAKRVVTERRWGGHRTRIIKEDHDFVLLSLVLIKQKKSKTKRDVGDVAPEAEGCKELTQDGVLPCHADVGALNCTMMHGQEYACPGKGLLSCKLLASCYYW
jgi:hypothetical protein